MIWDKATRAQCEVWRAQCELWSVKKAVRSEKCGLWSFKCEVWSAKNSVWSVKSAVWSVECEECSEKCEVRSGASNVTCATGHHFRRVHARTGLAGARRMQVLYMRKVLYIYISLRQLPPRLVRVLLVRAIIVCQSVVLFWALLADQLDVAMFLEVDVTRSHRL